jgi:hypothetical protein
MAWRERLQHAHPPFVLRRQPAIRPLVQLPRSVGRPVRIGPLSIAPVGSAVALAGLVGGIARTDLVARLVPATPTRHLVGRIRRTRAVAWPWHGMSPSAGS